MKLSLRSRHEPPEPRHAVAPYNGCPRPRPGRDEANFRGRHRVSVILCFVAAIVSAWTPTKAAADLGQTRAGNPPPALRPTPTATGHELGFGSHLHIEPNTFLPRMRYRYNFAQTAAQGPLSGLWLEAALGPAIFFEGSVGGNTAFNLGYEFDPFSNLALTFSPVLRNDIVFHPPADYVGFVQTYGVSIRLYIDAHWVVFVNPTAPGWHLWTVPGDSGIEFAWQGGAGFGYKF